MLRWKWKTNASYWTKTGINMTCLTCHARTCFHNTHIMNILELISSDTFARTGEVVFLSSDREFWSTMLMAGYMSRSQCHHSMVPVSFNLKINAKGNVYITACSAGYPGLPDFFKRTCGGSWGTRFYWTGSSWRRRWWMFEQWMFISLWVTIWKDQTSFVNLNNRLFGFFIYIKRVTLQKETSNAYSLFSTELALLIILNHKSVGSIDQNLVKLRVKLDNMSWPDVRWTLEPKFIYRLTHRTWYLYHSDGRNTCFVLPVDHNKTKTQIYL